MRVRTVCRLWVGVTHIEIVTRIETDRNSVHFMKVFEVIRAIRVLNSQERVIESIRERTGIQPVFSMYDAKRRHQATGSFPASSAMTAINCCCAHCTVFGAFCRAQVQNRLLMLRNCAFSTALQIFVDQKRYV